MGIQEPFLLTCELGTEKESCAIRRKNFLCSAPTFSQLFRWFREKYELYSWIHLHNGYLNNSYYKKLPITWTIMEHESGKQYYERDIDHNYLYHTQEEAELACLDKLIEITENKMNIKLKLSPELDFSGYLDDLDTIKSIYKEHKGYLVDKSGLTPNELDDAWSDFISDLIGDEWKLENINTVDEFLNMFLENI